MPHVRSARPPTSSSSPRPPPTCSPGPRTAWPTTCSPHPAHRPLPGAVRAGDAHRDVGAPGHPGQRRHPARPRASHVLDPAVGPAHRRRHRPGPAARAGRDRRGRPSLLARRRRRAAADLGRAGTSWSPPAAPASRSTRCASSATAPPASRASRSPARPRPAGAAVTLVAANVAVPTAGRASTVVARRDRRRAARRRCDGRGADADVVVMAAAVADFRPAPASAHKIKKGGGAGRRRSSSSATPTSSPSSSSDRRDRARSSSASPPRPATTTATCSTTAGPSRPQGRDLLVVNEVGDGKAFGQTTTTVHAARRRRRATSTAVGRAPRTRSPTRCWDAVVPPAARAGPASLNRARRHPPDVRATGQADRHDGRSHSACSPPSPSPRATRTRSATRSATRILDAMLAQDPHSRVAVETLVTTGWCTSPAR